MQRELGLQHEGVCNMTPPLIMRRITKLASRHLIHNVLANPKYDFAGQVGQTPSDQK